MSAFSGADRMSSLRWRLTAVVTAAMLLTWVVTGVVSYGMARHEAEELMDGGLAQAGHLLLAIVADNEAQLPDLARRLAGARGPRQSIYEPPLEFQAGRGDGTVLIRSLDAPTLPILGVEGYSDIVRRDEAWRVLNLVSADGRYRVQVSQDISLRDRAALEVASQTVLPLLVLVPVLVVLVYFSVRGGLRPLDRLAREVAARSPENLAQLQERRVPTEARPLVSALNRLFARVDRALEGERRFTADAAHELRTPLAALKVQAQVARLSRDEHMRENALRQISSGVDRATHLVEQLLRLARLDPQQGLDHPEVVSLPAVIEAASAAVMTAVGSGRRIETPPAEPPVLVRGEAELLGIAVRNLLDNALRYTRPGDDVRVALHVAAGQAAIVVRDTGPGVSDEVAGRLGERFFRAADGGTEGSGLGLAIVMRIAELHGARFHSRNLPEGGFEARIEGLALQA